ncbi:GPO family capsid scaffolding protein [Serratia marcescens]|jgi:hypothetical protein|uniref:GPO family capsid scaffolding protein n=1 Tax=Serratia marcescens TaxID=615 RepID=UPI002DA905BA|nr:GPO family capsid scaffolding protein [Serratia marcescens]MEB5609202.1 GPO family capsid scaffolding protein [Serratia marcescens]
MNSQLPKQQERWFLVAIEGAGIDGRVLSADQIRQMAANFEPKELRVKVTKDFLSKGSAGYLSDVTSAALGERNGKVALLVAFYETEALRAMAENAKENNHPVFPAIGMMKRDGSYWLAEVGITRNPSILGTDPLTFDKKAEA